MVSPLTYWKILHPATRRFLGICFGISLVLHVITAICSIGFYMYDEHYQIIEFAWIKLGHSSAANMPWEYRAMSRPTLQPWIAYLVFKAMGNADPFAMTMVLRFISAAIGLFSLVPFSLMGMQLLKTDWVKKTFVLLLAIFPMEAFIHARFSSEGFGGTFLLLGIALLLISRSEDVKTGRRNLYLAMSGIVLAVAMVCRLQLGVCFAGMAVWVLFVEKMPWKQILFLVIPAAFTLFFCALLDRMYYGVWVNSLWNYFNINLLQGKAATFGHEPFLFFVNQAIFKAGTLWGWIFFICILAGWGRRPLSIFTLAFVPFFIFHCFITNKELRFLMPMLSVLPLFIAFCIDGLHIKPLKEWKPVLKTAFYITITVFAFSWVRWEGEICFAPARPEFGAYLYMDRYRDQSIIFMTKNAGDPPYGPPEMNMSFYKPTPLIEKYRDLSPEQIRGITRRSSKPVFIYFFSNDLSVPDFLKKAGIKCQLEYYDYPDWLLTLKSWHIFLVRPMVVVFRLQGR